MGATYLIFPLLILFNIVEKCCGINGAFCIKTLTQKVRKKFQCFLAWKSSSPYHFSYQLISSVELFIIFLPTATVPLQRQCNFSGSRRRENGYLQVSFYILFADFFNVERINIASFPSCKVSPGRNAFNLFLWIMRLVIRSSPICLKNSVMYVSVSFKLMRHPLSLLVPFCASLIQWVSQFTGFFSHSTHNLY